MSRDQAAYIADMLEACERICSYVVDLNERTLRDDTKTVDAILRNLAVLGEAAKLQSGSPTQPETSRPRFSGAQSLASETWSFTIISVSTSTSFAT